MASYRGIEIGPECECCGKGDPRFLTRRRLDGEAWTTLCGDCNQLAGKRRLTVDQLIGERFPAGDRRGEDRRGGDRRVPLERRGKYDQRDSVRDTADRRALDRRTG